MFEVLLIGGVMSVFFPTVSVVLNLSNCNDEIKVDVHG